MNKHQYIRHIISEEIRYFLSEENFKINCATSPLSAAVKYSEIQFKANNKSLYDVIPDFDKNYQVLQNKCNKALNIPRIDMPVINQSDIKHFYKTLKTGFVDIFKPYANNKPSFPTNLDRKTGKEWLRLGVKDGNKTDDITVGKLVKIAAKKLLPTQSEIWLENIIPNIIKHGVPTDSSPITKAIIIVSEEGYILDGHHRFGQAMLSNPDLKLNALLIPLKIETLLKIGRSYGNAVGNKQKQ